MLHSEQRLVWKDGILPLLYSALSFGTPETVSLYDALWREVELMVARLTDHAAVKGWRTVRAETGSAANMIIFFWQKYFSMQKTQTFKVIFLFVSELNAQQLYILKKKLLLPLPLPLPLSENGPSINNKKRKTKSFRNTKFSIQIVFSMKMCKMPSSKIKDPWGPCWGPP